MYERLCYPNKKGYCITTKITAETRQGLQRNTNVLSLSLFLLIAAPQHTDVKDRDVEHQTQHTDDVRLFIGIIDTYTWCNNKTNVT